MLSRDELAARFAVADYGAKVATIYAGDPSQVGGATFYDDVADEAFKMADAFLDSAESIDARPVKSGPSAPVAPKSDAAKYEPRVGDVCRYVRDTGSTFVITRITRDGVYWKRTGVKSDSDVHSAWPEDIRFVRPATPSELAAAGLPSPEATRPTWVRITGPSDADNVTVGKVYAVKAWDKDGCPEIVNDRGYEWFLPDPTDREFSSSWPSWEPAPPPAPVEPAKGEADELTSAPKWVNDAANAIMRAVMDVADPDDDLADPDDYASLRGAIEGIIMRAAPQVRA